MIIELKKRKKKIKTKMEITNYLEMKSSQFTMCALGNNQIKIYWLKRSYLKAKKKKSKKAPNSKY